MIDRQSNASLEVRRFESVRSFDRNHWDVLFPQSHASHAFHQNLEETLNRQFKFYYFGIYKKGKLIGVFPCFIMDYAADVTFAEFLKEWTAEIRKWLPRFLRPRILFCGSPAGEGTAGIDRSQCPPDVISSLLNEMHRTAAEEKASFLIFKGFPDSYRDFLSPLLKHGFHKIESYPGAELDINFRSFEEYMTSLSKSSRKDIRRKFKDIDCRPAIKTEVRHALGPYLDEAYQLYLETFRKSTVRFEEITREFFQNISKHMPEQTKYFLWFIRGKLAAFDLCLLSGNCLVDEYAGMDHSLVDDFHLDYAIFRDVMNWCIDHGIRKYRSGALNYGPKQRLEFKFKPLSIYAKHMNGFLNPLLGLAKNAVDPYHSDPVLKALKKKQGGKKQRDFES